MLLDPAIQKIIEDNVKAYFVLILLFVCAVRFFLLFLTCWNTSNIHRKCYNLSIHIDLLYEDRTLVASDGSLPSTSDILK